MKRRPFQGSLLHVGALVLGGCAHYDELAAGQALTIGDGRRASALSLEIAEGAGASRDTGSTLAEGRARMLVGVERQQLAGLLGGSRLQWLGDRTPLWGHVNIGPGLEHLSLDGEHRFLFEAIAQARLGTGFVLGEEREWMSELNPWGPEAAAGAAATAVTEKRFMRKRVLLTLGVAGDVDGRFTRAPLYVASLMLGIALVEEPRRLPKVAVPLLW